MLVFCLLPLSIIYKWVIVLVYLFVELLVVVVVLVVSTVVVAVKTMVLECSSNWCAKLSKE